MNKSRYFLVFLEGKNEKGNRIRGMTDFVTNGFYLNHKKMIETLKEDHSATNVIITNIIELNQSDYNDFFEDEN